MGKKRKPRGNINAIVVIVTDTMAEVAAGELDRHVHDNEATNELLRTVLAEHADGRLRRRVHRYVTRNPMMVTAPRKINDALLHEIAWELIAAEIGNCHVPKGIEDGDTWLTPGGTIQKMLLESQSEDAIMVIMAQRDDDGSLQPTFFWTENEEIIAEAQKGHRKYMTLVAAESSR